MDPSIYVWFKQFCEIGGLCKGKSPVGLSVSEFTVGMESQSYVISPQKWCIYRIPLSA
jgi:hypothetical protein